MTAFSTLTVLPAAQLANLNELGYLSMTPVQAAALPAILAGKDVRVQAKTGSGKTAAFGLGLLQHIDPARFETQSLVLCPTRELADQVAGELRRLARCLPNIKILMLCGGQPFGAQRDSLQHAPHIIVATPGRLLDHLQKGTVSLDALQTLVMDEADRMLDMGFSDAIDEVIRFAPADRQTLLFSATWPAAIAAISGRVQRNPQTIEIDTVDALPAIEQQFFEVSRHGKIALLQRLLSQHQPASCVVFCNTKRDCQAVCDALNAAGQSALSLHGDLEQRDRDQTLVRFANGSVRVLVATDVAARGIDIPDVSHVFNFDMPRSGDTYLHRIGRTARAGRKGTAISLVEAHDHLLLGKVGRYIEEPIKARVIDELRPKTRAPSEKQTGKPSKKVLAKRAEKKKAKEKEKPRVKKRHRDTKNIGKRRKPSGTGVPPQTTEE